MGKELIRNGGFEKGTFDFWEPDGYWSIDSSANKHRGSYCAKCYLTAVVTSNLNISDYIEVRENEIYRLLFWLKNISMNHCYIYAYFVDSNKEEIEWVLLEDISTDAAIKKHVYHFRIPEEAAFMQVNIAPSSGNTHVCYLDDVSLQHVKVEDLAVKEATLINIINETTKHTVTGEEFFTGIWKEAEYFFDLTSFTAIAETASVTIDVKVESLDPKTGIWHDAMVFQQKSCPVGGSVTTQEYKRLTGNLGWKQRVSYTTAGAGTIGDCDFKVGAVYKR